MTILRLSDGGALLSELLQALEGLQEGVRIGVRDTQTGNIYRIGGAVYDTTRMAVVLSFDSSNPITLPTV